MGRPRKEDGCITFEGLKKRGRPPMKRRGRPAGQKLKRLQVNHNAREYAPRTAEESISSSDDESSQMTQNRLERILLNHIADVKQNQQQIMDELNTIKATLKNIRSAPPVASAAPAINVSSVPKVLTRRPLLQSMADFYKFETEERSEEERASLIRELMYIGGSNEKTFTHSCMKTLMNSYLSAHFSFYGAKGKWSFSTTKTFLFIRDAVQQLFPESTETSIKETISMHLRNAPALYSKSYKNGDDKVEKKFTNDNH